MRINSLNPFPDQPGFPAPLRLRIKKEIRFGECDPMGVLWHGNYAQCFEEVRETLSRACGLGFEVLQRAGVFFPIKTMFVDYCKPLRYGYEYFVEIVVHWSESMRVNAEYFIVDLQGDICTRGFSVQLMVDTRDGLILDSPPFYQEFKADWAGGKFSAFQNAQVNL
jgi:acyl-CoA thioester hydrolase